MDGAEEESRGTPIVVQVMFIYFALPLLADIRVDAEWAAIVTLIINSGAYISEIVRGSLLSVHKGLKEAGQAMGLPFHKILLHIIGPVAFRRMRRKPWVSSPCSPGCHSFRSGSSAPRCAGTR